ncbi:MAG: glycosyltransferase family 39 protein [Candidatus Omnitrophica bacterium]|nr:glycosyltransferase family 39 protein [Candidatus Omnitrophota bacterium]
MRFINNISKHVARHSLFYAVTLSLIVLYGFVNFVWLHENRYLYGQDEFQHLIITLNYHHALVTDFPKFISTLFTQSGFWPPFYHIMAALFCLPFGYSYVCAGMTNMLYLLVLLSSVYFIGQRVFDRNVGVIAVVCLAFYPAVFVASRVFNPDFALTAVVSLAIAFLIASDGFSRPRISLWLGVICGVGMLVKQTFVFFFLGPLVVVLFGVVVRGQAELLSHSRQLRNAAVSLCVGVAVALPWYVVNAALVFNRSSMFQWDMAHRKGGIGSSYVTKLVFQPDKFFNYVPMLVNEGITLAFFIFLIGMGVFFCRRKSMRSLLFLWILIPYVVLSFSFQKEIRFLLPIFPALALVTAAGLSQLKARWLRRVLLLLLVFIGCAQFFFVSFYLQDKNEKPLISTRAMEIYASYFSRRPQDVGRRGPPWGEDWHFDRMAEIIKSAQIQYHWHPGVSPRFIGVITADAPARNVVSCPSAIDYYLLENGVADTATVHLLGFLATPEAFFLWKEFDAFIVISRDDPWPEALGMSINYEDRVKQIARTWAHEKFRIKERMPLMAPFLHMNPSMARSVAEGVKDFFKHKPEQLHLIGKVAIPRGLSAYVYWNEK